MNSTPLTGVDKETAAAAIDVIEQLRRVPQASQTLNGIPVGLRLSNNDGRWISIQDAWGSPLRCLTEQSASASDRQTVAANGGRPLFMSAGPDRLFGANNVTAMGDDLMLHPTLNH
jgi:hypothetical protein